MGRYCMWTQKAGASSVRWPDDVRVEAGETARPYPLVMREDASAIRGMIVGVDGAGKSTTILYAPIRWSKGGAGRKRSPSLTASSSSTSRPERRSTSINDRTASRRRLHSKRAWRPDQRGVVIALKPLPIIELVVQDEGAERAFPSGTWTSTTSRVPEPHCMNQRRALEDSREVDLVLRFDAAGLSSRRALRPEVRSSDHRGDARARRDSSPDTSPELVVPSVTPGSTAHRRCRRDCAR